MVERPPPDGLLAALSSGLSEPYAVYLCRAD